MKDLIGQHFDICVVATIGVLLLIAYVILLMNGIDSKAIELTMVSAISGAVGMGAKKVRGDVNVEGDVNVKEPKE